MDALCRKIPRNMLLDIVNKFGTMMNTNPGAPMKLITRGVKEFRYIRPRDPEVVKQMPTFQYAKETSKLQKRVYLWGRTESGAVGHATFVRPDRGRRLRPFIHRPYRSDFAEEYKVRDVACGYGYTVFIVSSDKTDHQLFGTGLNTDCQIGYHEVRKGHPLGLIAQPVPIHLPFNNPSTKILKVGCGRAHTVILTDKEGVLTLGNNAYGQCGRPIVEGEDYQHAQKVNRVKGIDGQVTEIVCGQDHTLFLTDSNEVYSCGWGADGQTGLGHYKNQGIPQKVRGDIEGEKIVGLSGSADCVLAVSDKGDVFAWGNSEYGQFRSVTDEQQINTPKHLPLKDVGRVVQIASGGTMCAVLNDKGQVFVWGYGILGKGPKVAQELKPSLIPETLFGKNEICMDTTVAQITCGLNFFAAVTNKGDLYMWGKNHYGCLGLGHEVDQYFPFRVCVPAQVLKVSCGVDHTAALCRSFA